jgi:hypothetical protein
MVKKACVLTFAILTGLILVLVGIGCQSSNASQIATTPITSAAAPGSTSAAGTVSFASDIKPIIQQNCACHQSAAGAGGLSLAPGNEYKNLVGVKSTQSTLALVKPGSPDESYLLNKLLGSQAQAGGSGSRMPTGSALSQTQISLIRQWVTNGAPEN